MTRFSTRTAFDRTPNEWSRALEAARARGAPLLDLTVSNPTVAGIVYDGRAITAALADEHYQRLQIALMLRPEQGDLIRGSGGLRKVRWALSGAGKRGGLRIIYYWSASDRAFYMLYAYSKNEQGDLTAAQARALRKLVREEFE